MKSCVDKLDIDKLENVQTNLSNMKNRLDELDIDKLSDVGKNEVVEKGVS